MPWRDHAYCFEQPLLDLASGSFPTGLHQDPEIDRPAEDFKPRSELDAEVNARCQCRCSYLKDLILTVQTLPKNGETVRSDCRLLLGDWRRRKWWVCSTKSRTLWLDRSTSLSCAIWISLCFIRQAAKSHILYTTFFLNLASDPQAVFRTY
jgi:hypothetical protein